MILATVAALQHAFETDLSIGHPNRIDSDWRSD
ncbi:MAG: hypothetical protein ACI9HK_006251 [Pirellulaceae bacterium]|jgi:hypothetical protein